MIINPSVLLLDEPTSGWQLTHSQTAGHTHRLLDTQVAAKAQGTHPCHGCAHTRMPWLHTYTHADATLGMLRCPCPSYPAYAHKQMLTNRRSYACCYMFMWTCQVECKRTCCEQSWHHQGFTTSLSSALCQCKLGNTREEFMMVPVRCRGIDGACVI